MKSQKWTERWEWLAEVATVMLGIAVVTGLVLKWPRTSESLTGTWETRAADRSADLSVQRLEFKGPNGGWWRRVAADSAGLASDSTAFSMEGPRDNRFCLRLPPSSHDCIILEAFHDSLVVDQQSRIYRRSSNASRLVFSRVR